MINDQKILKIFCSNPSFKFKSDMIDIPLLATQESFLLSVSNAAWSANEDTWVLDMHEEHIYNGE